MSNSDQIPKPSFFLSTFSVFALVYYTFFAVLFTISFFKIDLITNALNNYLEESISTPNLFLYSLLGCLLSVFFIYSIILMRRLNKRGYIIYMCLGILSSVLLSLMISFDMIYIGVQAFFMLGFTLQYKRFYF